MYDVTAGRAARLRGLIPTGWYPTTPRRQRGRHDPRQSARCSASARGTAKPGALATGRYVHAVRGSVNVIPVPSDAELAAYTTAVAQNNRLALRSGPAAPSIAPRANAVARAVPERPGRGVAHRSTSCSSSARTAPTTRCSATSAAARAIRRWSSTDATSRPTRTRCANQFVLLDHFFASGGNSADGHQWLTQANETEYPMWPLYVGPQLSIRGKDALTYSSGGFLWEAAQAKGRTVTRVRRVRAPAAAQRRRGARTVADQYRDSIAARRLRSSASSSRGGSTRTRTSRRSTRCSCASIPGGRRRRPTS